MEAYRAVMPYHFTSIKAHCRNKINKVDKRQIAHFLLFLSGIGILIWQIWNTFQGFIEGQTSFSTSQQTFEVLEPPGMILCPKNIWSGYSNTIFSNKDWDSKHFLKVRFIDWMVDKLNRLIPLSHFYFKMDLEKRKMTTFIEVSTDIWRAPHPGHCHEWNLGSPQRPLYFPKGYPLWDPFRYGLRGSGTCIYKGNRAALSCLSQGKRGSQELGPSRVLL